jgi:hypothetical protein
MLSSWIAPVVGGLLMLSQVAMGNPVPQATGGIKPGPGSIITCGTTFKSQPKMDDCIAAVNLIAPTGQPQICTTVFITEATKAVYGTCTIKGWDNGGKAHCMSGANIATESMNIINTCALKGLEYIAAGGKAEFTGFGNPTVGLGKGVILLRTANV